MSLLTVDNQALIEVLRQKAADGTATVEEMRQGIIILRAGRLGAAYASDASRAKKAKKVIRTADELLADLGL